MGYFSNGSEGMSYQDKYCDKCVHWHEEFGCPCWWIHQDLNYDECNNKESVLHKMIPQDKKGFNSKCFCFIEPKDSIKERAKDAEILRKYNEAMKGKECN